MTKPPRLNVRLIKRLSVPPLAPPVVFPGISLGALRLSSWSFFPPLSDVPPKSVCLTFHFWTFDICLFFVIFGFVDTVHLLQSFGRVEPIPGQCDFLHSLFLCPEDPPPLSSNLFSFRGSDALHKTLVAVFSQSGRFPKCI